MRVLICGGTQFSDAPLAYAAFDAAREWLGITAICHGAATGGDTIADNWAEARGIPRTPYKAEWRPNGTYNPSAGIIRNEHQLRAFRPEAGLALPGANGTADMTRRLWDAGVPTWRLEGRFWRRVRERPAERVRARTRVRERGGLDLGL